MAALPLLVVLVLLLHSTSSRSAATTSPSDLPVLLDLSASLSPSPFDPSSDPCASWPGVACSPSGRVVAVRLPRLNLSGTLPPSLRNLTSLARLELQSNRLRGPLPSLRGLSLLQTLLLHDNLFSAMPDDFFSGLSSLQSFSLDSNPFPYPFLFPASLRDATALVNFSANAVNLSGSVPAVFADGSLPSLSSLALAYNRLSGPLPAALAAGSPLATLWLNNQRGAGPDGALLSGRLDVVANMTNLVQLWLHSNNFSGPIPDLSALHALRDLQLRDNRLTGPVPRFFPPLRRLTLANNLLQGELPVIRPPPEQLEIGKQSFCLDTPGPCDRRVDQLLSVLEPLGYPERFAEDWTGNDPCAGWLGISCDRNGSIVVVNFRNMDLAGTISPAFASLASLQKLLLGGNRLTGTIPPALASLAALTDLDLSRNSLRGPIPAFGPQVRVAVNGNAGLAAGTPDPARSNDSAAADAAAAVGGGRSRSNRSLGGTIAAVAGAASVFLVAMLVAVWIRRRARRSAGTERTPSTMVIHPRFSGSDPDVVKATVVNYSITGGAAAGTSDDVSRTGSGSSRGDARVVEPGNMVISIQVLRNVTGNFSEDNVLGRGGFGTVYRGELHDGTKIAVKRMEAAAVGTKALEEFRSEISVLSKVRHRHLVSLLGYCLDGSERLLVYEYMPQGTLSRHLFAWKEEGLRPLEWKRRLSIALDVARGVEYLHSLAHQSFIHRDLKPSNILLGDDMKAKVADFGLVRLAPDGKCSVETKLAGTFGYLAPEYAVTGRVTTKADVFSFGVILMELISGRKALDESQPEESVHLVTWFRRMQLSKDSFHKAVDSTIDLDDDTMASIRTVAELAGHCCAREPYQRPDMGHAVNVLSSLAELWKPTELDSEESYGIDLNLTLPQALKKWQAYEGDSHLDGGTTSYLAGMDDTQTSIPTRPVGFAESFTSADGR